MHLDVYVTDLCANCKTALSIAARARSTIVDLEVRVIDLALPGQNIPSHIVAVPTYLLDGQVISLGNPNPEQFLALLQQHLKEKTG